MFTRFRLAIAVTAIAAVAATQFSPLTGRDAFAVPNPVATDEASYQAFGRVWPDPHGCLATGVPDTDGDGIKDTPQGVSPWAKGRVCADQYLQYQEVIEGAKFLERRFPEYLKVVKLEEAYDNLNYRSAGLPRGAVVDDGKVKILGRDRRPLYMFKVTDATSEVPEKDRLHFAYSLSIHGIERAGVEGGTRAMEDLVTWAACENEKYIASTPACAIEGPFPKSVVETPSEAPAPTAGDVLDNAVIYFTLPNPDGWARGQVAPVEVEDGSPNVNYQPGFFFQRYNGNGVDLNRDWPTRGYTFTPYSPGSEPETKAFGEVLSGIKEETSAGRFAGGIDMHGMLTADAFSYTLIGAGQRDFRKNELTVDTAVRTWRDQTQRLAWSPYIADTNADGVTNGSETCLAVPAVGGNAPTCVADEWGTVIDTLGYQVTGGFGDWIDSDMGLDAVGIDNEMYASHLAPNTVFEPALEQSHIDGNKGLIYSQLASLFTEENVQYDPPGKIGYVFNPHRLQVDAQARPARSRLPAQNDIEAVLPCLDGAPDSLGGCDGGTFVPSVSPSFEFDVKGPVEGVFNGGVSVVVTKPNALGVSDGNAFGMQLQHFDEGQWHTVASDYNQSLVYAQAGMIVTANDPTPGRWRVVFGNAAQLPLRVTVDFQRDTAEASPGQAEIDASSMDFFTELNEYVPNGEELEAVTIENILSDPAALDAYDSIVVVNDVGSRFFLTDTLGFSPQQADDYFAALGDYARGGGNLVLTDSALQVAPEIGLISVDYVRKSQGLAGNYNFQIQNGLVTYTNPDIYPLTRGVEQPGAAEQQLGRRQAVEPTPLGYTPDTGDDPDPLMPYWGFTKTGWNEICGLPNCTSATTAQNGSVVNLGEASFGAGTVRIAGILLPDPIYEPDEANDHRFGLASYALTYTAYEVFQNLLTP